MRRANRTPRGTEVSARQPVLNFSLGQAERDQRWLVDRGRNDQTMVALKSGESGPGLRPDQPVDCTGIISLVAQRHLHILEHLTRGQVVVAVDRLVVDVVIVVGIVAVGRIPVVAPPILIATAEENEGEARVGLHASPWDI